LADVIVNAVPWFVQVNIELSIGDTPEATAIAEMGRTSKKTARMKLMPKKIAINLFLLSGLPLTAKLKILIKFPPVSLNRFMGGATKSLCPLYFSPF